MCLGSKRPAPAPATPPPPTMQDEVVQQSRDDERRRRQAAGGAQSTILTGPTGATGGKTQGKTLLGS